MMGKVIYVSFIRLTDKVLNDFYIDYLIAKGVDVEYWDIVSLVREEHRERGEKTPSYLHVFRTFSEVEARLRLIENKGATYMMMITYEGRFTKIFRLLSKYNCRMIAISWGIMPLDPAPNLVKFWLKFLHPLLLPKKIFQRVKAIAYRKLKMVKPFDIVFAGGRLLMASDQYAIKVIPTNLCDYDYYMQVKSVSDRVVQGSYVVFLDINLPYQSDLAICGLPVIDPLSYYASLNRFFGWVEFEYGVKVVIATHPKAIYGAEVFEGRETYAGRTPELVRDADFVISHTSTAISYAVLNMKPIVFIYTDEMLKVYKYTVIRELSSYSRYLDAVMCNIDAVVQGKQIVINSPNLSCYQNYKYDFITTPESENFLGKEIFWREINVCS